jgi:hypothetical protein
MALRNSTQPRILYMQNNDRFDVFGAYDGGLKWVQGF